MDTPLKAIRLRRELTLAQVATAVDSDTGNLSRIEKGKQTASVELAAKLARFFGHEVTEMQILYPKRYMAEEDETTDIERNVSAIPHTTHARATNGDTFGTPLKRRAEDKIDEKESA